MHQMSKNFFKTGLPSLVSFPSKVVYLLVTIFASVSPVRRKLSGEWRHIGSAGHGLTCMLTGGEVIFSLDFFFKT